MCQVSWWGTENLTVEHADVVSTPTGFIIWWEMQASTWIWCCDGKVLVRIVVCNTSLMCLLFQDMLHNLSLHSRLILLCVLLSLSQQGIIAAHLHLYPCSLAYFLWWWMIYPFPIRGHLLRLWRASDVSCSLKDSASVIIPPFCTINFPPLDHSHQTHML